MDPDLTQSHHLADSPCDTPTGVWPDDARGTTSRACCCRLLVRRFLAGGRRPTHPAVAIGVSAYSSRRIRRVSARRRIRVDRTIAIAASIVASVVVMAGCGELPGVGAGPSDSTPAPLAPLGPGQPVAPPDGADTERSHSAGWITDCIRYVQVGAFGGNPDLSDLWNSVDGDAAGIRTICERFTGTDFADLGHAVTQP